MSDAEDERKERQHFLNVLKAFDEYLVYCLSANNARRKSFLSIPMAHQHLLKDVGSPLPWPDDLQQSSGSVLLGFRNRIEEIDDRIRRNADLLAQIAEESRGFLGPDPVDGNGLVSSESGSGSISSSNSEKNGTSQAHGSAERSRSRDVRKRRRISGQEVDKIQSTLKQLVRDWSQEGASERTAVYQPIIDAVLQRFGNVDTTDRGQINVLVPGAGLGRLAFDFAKLGFSCQGNEFSFYMLLASHYMLNKTSKIHQHTIYPFVHSSSNWKSASHMLRAISIPDVLPSSLPKTCNFSMVAGEFCEVYSRDDEKAAWNVVATCFFIDTAKNIIRYLETINHTLTIGGYWINAGPLLWHFENAGEARSGSEILSIELTLDELLSLIPKMGFEIEVSQGRVSVIYVSAY